MRTASTTGPCRGIGPTTNRTRGASYARRCVSFCPFRSSARPTWRRKVGWTAIWTTRAIPGGRSTARTMRSVEVRIKSDFWLVRLRFMFISFLRNSLYLTRHFQQTTFGQQSGYFLDVSLVVRHPLGTAATPHL
uniref:(northern house mosquito) hypothetical protein n=1 Tax=Culex pipiens TaxID=7175 RepID=A0A8D8B760_CULPI